MIVLGRFAALVVCVFGFPLHLVISALISVCDGGSALYPCTRLGQNGKTFTLFKYRSMKVDASHVLSRGLKMIVQVPDSRVTPLGRFLRCGLDELPQLWNVARGEMAWIGPRPDPDWILPHYGEACRRRLCAVPGITGFAQILNSRHLSAAEGYALDMWYLAHHTVALDIWIALVTPLFMAGWRYPGRKRLHSLRTLPEFRDLRRRCEKDLFKARLSLFEAPGNQIKLPPNTVIR
jgi:undecaprenyl phosphate N,N'-diacetylbacillosamine 1-phosphate transferase